MKLISDYEVFTFKLFILNVHGHTFKVHTTYDKSLLILHKQQESIDRLTNTFINIYIVKGIK